jgi:hypothetical protein
MRCIAFIDGVVANTRFAPTGIDDMDRAGSIDRINAHQYHRVTPHPLPLRLPQRERGLGG